MHKEYILLNGFRKAKRGFTAGFHVPLKCRNTFEESVYRCYIMLHLIVLDRPTYTPHVYLSFDIMLCFKL